MTNKMISIAKLPSECTDSELLEFKRLVQDGGEVSAQGLEARIKNAASLIYHHNKEGVVCGIGAIKNPNTDYKTNVFSKAEVKQECNQYSVELGWLYVRPEARKTGIGGILMETCIQSLGNSTCFSTTREDNLPVHRLFEKYGFIRLGVPYKGNGEYNLILFGRKS